MKIVIAPDSFKESLSAKQVCESIEAGFREIYPTAQYVHLPLADGGEGTVEVLLQGLKGEVKQSQVSGPLGESINASWALLDEGKTALIEIAAASGLDLVPAHQRDPSRATTYGSGELIKQALDLGVTKILLGLGGSATNDGGAGIVQALGGKLLNRAGEELPLGAQSLAELAQIDLSTLDSRCADVKMVIACDVANPLVGTEGASFVFGPQKGASISQVEQFDNSLEHFAALAAKTTGVNHAASKGFGAAGGAPLGLSLAFEIKLQSGIEVVLDTLNADNVLLGADLLITGEGQMDNQTLQGKTPYGIAKRAQVQAIPVIGIAGSLGNEIDELYGVIDSTFASVRSPQTLQQVLNEASFNLTRTARNVAATLKLGAQLFNEK